MRSEDENAVLRERLRMLYEGCYNLFLPFPSDDRMLVQRHAAAAAQEKHQANKNHNFRKRNRYAWGLDFLSLAACTVGGVIWGASYNFLTAGNTVDYHDYKLKGALLVIFGLLCFIAHKVLESYERRNARQIARLQEVVDNYMIYTASNPIADNAGKINALLISGIATLETGAEMHEVFDRLEKYGVGWPNLSGHNAKEFFDRLAATSTTLKNDAEVPGFILREFHWQSKLPSSTPEEKAQQARDRTH